MLATILFSIMAMSSAKKTVPRQTSQHIDGRPSPCNLVNHVMWDAAREWYNLGLLLLKEDQVCSLNNIEANNQRCC